MAERKTSSARSVVSILPFSVRVTSVTLPATSYSYSTVLLSGFSRDETLAFDDPKSVMERFAVWVKAETTGRPMFISDNNGFDWQFINWYFHHFTGQNLFGHSSGNLGSPYKGVVKDTFVSFNHLRKTKHTHHPVDDARGNAEALLRIKEEHGLKISLK